MSRLILINTNSGNIDFDTASKLQAFGDTDQSPEAATALFLSSIGYDVQASQFECLSSRPGKGVDGYEVYRADIKGSDAVALVTDGTDQEMIKAVERDCEYYGFVPFIPLA